MTEKEFEFELGEFLTIADQMDDMPTLISDYRTFDESGYLTNNKGLVVTTTDGSEFELTIVKRK